MRYSRLDQINRENVTRLKPVWTYHTRELEGRTGKTIECTPIVIDGVMYVTTGYLRVVALDAATGKELWQFDPLKDHPFEHQPTSGGVNRGCAYWSDGKPDGERRIIHGTSDGRLFSLDAKNGKLDPKFGDGGILQSPRGTRSEGRRARLWTDVRPGRLEGYDHRRRLVWRRARHRRAGGHPSVRRPHRRGGLAVPDRPRSGRVRKRDVERRFLEGPWRGERLGRVQRRRGSRPGLRRARIGRLRLLRRRPARRQSVRELHDRARREDGQARLALSDAAS